MDNQDDFAKIKLRQRVARNLENRSLKANRLGIDMAMPLAIAPTGLAGMVHVDGEILAARAATAAGIRYTLSKVRPPPAALHAQRRLSRL